MEDRIDFSKTVEMIVLCPDWREKERILRRVIKRLVELEKIQQIEDELKANENEYEQEI